MSEKVSLEQEYLATATRYFDENEKLKAEVKRLRGIIDNAAREFLKESDKGWETK